MRFSAPLSLAAVILLVSAHAAAQPEGRPQYAEEPTIGLETPLSPIAGEFDALATVSNPAGLMMLRGGHFGALFQFDDEDNATTPAQGWGLYNAFVLGGGVVPRIGMGFGLERLSPARLALTPDPGDPTRLTVAYAMALGSKGAFGLSWHRYFDDEAAPLNDASTWNLGLTWRLSPRFAFGAVVKDLTRPHIAGVPVQRRYEAELVVRPGATERFELALGGRLGETRLDADGWLRWSWRVVRGVYFVGEAKAQSLHEIVAVPGGDREDTIYEGRVTAGLELWFGRMGVTGLATTAFDDDGGNARLQSGSVYVRTSSEPRPGVFGDRDRLQRLDLRGGMGARRLTNTVLEIKAMREDPAVVGVFVQLDSLGIGWAGAYTLRAELAKLRADGKKVYAYLVAGTTREYYIASVANKVYVDPAGGLRLAGFAGTTIYFKGLFDLLGVEAQFEKIEEFKSAPEQWTRTSPTEPALRMRNELYDDMYATIVGDIATGRGVSRGEIEKLIDGGPYTAGQLRDLPALVDEVIEPDDLGKAIVKDMGRSVGFGARPQRRPDRWAHQGIAVIYIDGDIVGGQSQVLPVIGRKLVGGQTIAQAIAWARASPDIAAIVLSIDSPGGSALASEIMAREVFKTRGVKPIICSMGNVAASGGYFAAAGCDVIFAEPTTITGSIGIFTGKFDLSGLLSRLGLSWATFKRGAAADRESYFRGYTDDERAAVKKQIRYYYERFVGYVAKGRKMTDKQVDDVGRGRVWTGKQALEVGLVDQLGGVADAIAYAKKAAGIGKDTPAQLYYLPRPTGNLLSRLTGFNLQGEDELDAKAAAARAILPGADKLFDLVPGSVWAEPNVPQARLPYGILFED